MTPALKHEDFVNHVVHNQAQIKQQSFRILIEGRVDACADPDLFMLFMFNHRALFHEKRLWCLAIVKWKRSYKACTCFLKNRCRIMSSQRSVVKKYSTLFHCRVKQKKELSLTSWINNYQKRYVENTPVMKTMAFTQWQVIVTNNTCIYCYLLLPPFNLNLKWPTGGEVVFYLSCSCGT